MFNRGSYDVVRKEIALLYVIEVVF